MKVSATFERGSAIAAALLLTWISGPQVLPDTPGGTGVPMTPYHQTDATLSNIKRFKKDSSGKRYVRYIPVLNGQSIGPTFNVGLAYVKSGDIQGRVRSAFSGTDDKGKRIEVDLSEVEAFRILARQGDALSIRIARFPAITPEILISERPSYTALRKKHARCHRLRLSLRDNHGARLYIVHQDDDGEFVPLVSMADIQRGRRVEFPWNRRELLWWATPSVTSDGAYPFREHVKA